jgi:hypothetical protein
VAIGKESRLSCSSKVHMFASRAPSRSTFEFRPSRLLKYLT